MRPGASIREDHRRGCWESTLEDNKHSLGQVGGRRGRHCRQRKEMMPQSIELGRTAQGLAVLDVQGKNNGQAGAGL